MSFSTDAKGSNPERHWGHEIGGALGGRNSTTADRRSSLTSGPCSKASGSLQPEASTPSLVHKQWVEQCTNERARPSFQREGRPSSLSVELVEK